MFTPLYVKKTGDGGYVHMLKDICPFVLRHTHPVLYLGAIFDANKWLSGNAFLPLAFSWGREIKQVVDEFAG